MNENWTPKNPPPELSDSDAELLSAYIDNMLDAQEVAALEARLATDAFLRSELAAMRQMLGWLKTMPSLKAPRNFTISEADVKPAAPKIVPLPRRNNSWQIASAAAVFVLVLGGIWLFSQLDFIQKEPSNNLAAAPTNEAAEPLVAGTATVVFLPTMGAPTQENVIAAGAPQEEQDPAEIERSSDTPPGVVDNSSPTGESGETAPQAASSGGDNTDSSNTAFGGGAADGQLADIQVETTFTPAAELVYMATMTAPSMASPSPAPTLNAQAESSGFEPTQAAEPALMSSTEAASSSETTIDESSEVVAGESMMTMMVEESTEVIEAEAPTSDDYDGTAQTSASRDARLDVVGRINTVRQRILRDILER